MHICTPRKNANFPGMLSNFPPFLMYFIIQKVKISFQMAKFPGNDIPKFPIFSSHAYLFDWLITTTKSSSIWAKVMKLGMGEVLHSSITHVFCCCQCTYIKYLICVCISREPQKSGCLLLLSLFFFSFIICL